MMQCPLCHNDTTFRIAAVETVSACVYQYTEDMHGSQAGTLEITDVASHDDPTWEPTSACTCRACGYVATVEDFEREEG